jgi:hypothetical protein
VSSGDIRSCSPLKVTRRFGGTRRRYGARNQLCSFVLHLPPAFTLVSCSTYSSALTVEATCSSETSGDFQQSTRPYSGRTRGRSSCPGGTKHFLHVVQTDSGDLQWKSGVKRPGPEPDHSPLMPRLGECGSIHPLPHMSSWHSA